MGAFETVAGFVEKILFIFRMLSAVIMSVVDTPLVLCLIL